MKPRSAVTLIETLIAIFIMGIGLLALLTLFPLGALNMAQALKDDRTATAASNAQSLAKALRVRQNPLVLDAMRNPIANAISLGAPNTNAVLGPAAQRQAPRTGAVPSYPVLVDPLGFRSYQVQGNAVRQFWVAGRPNGIRRVTLGNDPDGNPFDFTNLSNPNLSQQIRSVTTFLDDMTFLADGDDAGRPVSPPSPTSLVERDFVYSWAYLCRMGNASREQLVDMDIIVYRKRSFDGAGGLSGLETSYNATFRPAGQAKNVVRLTWTAAQPKPAIRKGGWILDASVPRNSPAALRLRRPQGFFYRVVNVTDVNNTTMELELQTDARNTNGARAAEVVVLENVVEVFPKGTR